MSSSSFKVKSQFKFIIGCILVSTGTLLSAGGGSWDITNHLLNKPETFFSPPHAVLYAGAALAVAGAATIALSRRAPDSSAIKLPALLIFVGVGMLVSAGPIDFVWHSTFGLDGLLSPPHFVLLGGMVISSIGSLLGIVYRNYQARYSYEIENENTDRSVINSLLLILAIAPVLIASSGMVHMFSLPFSETPYFDFDPHPTAAAILATLGFPFVTSFLLYSSWAFAGKSKFGIMSAVGAAFIAISAASSIAPNEHLIPTLPFYFMNIIPIVAADALFSFFPSKISNYIAGAIIGAAFLMLYYPLVTHTYNETFIMANVWPSVTAQVYFGMIDDIYPVIIGPAIALGILGVIMAQRFATRIELGLLA